MFLLILITLSSLIYFFNPDYYKSLVKEDGLIENISAISLLLLAIMLLYRIFRRKKSKGAIWIIFNIILAIVIFFGFGEEISWGQRIFDLQPNKFFLENNLQEETNLHNLKINGLKVNIIVFTYIFGLIFSFYLFIATFLYKKSTSFKSIINAIGLPLPKVRHAIYFILATLIILAIPNSRIWEVWESFNVLLVFLIFIEPYNSSEKLLS